MKNRFVPEKCKAFSADKKWCEISGGQHHTLALDGEGKGAISDMSCKMLSL